MNEQILKASRRALVAEFLQRPCEVPASIVECDDSITLSFLYAAAIIEIKKPHPNVDCERRRGQTYSSI